MDSFFNFETSTFDGGNDLQWLDGNDSKIDLEAVMAAVGIVPEKEAQNPLPVLNELDLHVASSAQTIVSPPVYQNRTVHLAPTAPPNVNHGVKRRMSDDSTVPMVTKKRALHAPTAPAALPAAPPVAPLAAPPKVNYGVNRPMSESRNVPMATKKRVVHVASAHNLLNQIMGPQRKPKAIQPKVARTMDNHPNPNILRPEMFQVNIPDIGSCYTNQPQPGGDVYYQGGKKGKKSEGQPKRRSNKPSTGYLEMIARALLSAPGHRMILNDIYTYILQWYPYFQTAPSTWRNAVRHNLTVNDCFVKTGNTSSGRGYIWEIHPACVDMFSQGDFRRMQARRLAQQHYNSENIAPEEVQTPTQQTSVPTTVIQNVTKVPAASQMLFPSSNYSNARHQQKQVSYNQSVAVPTSVYQQNYMPQIRCQTMNQSSYEQHCSNKVSGLQQNAYPTNSPVQHQQQSSSFYPAIPDISFELDQFDADFGCPTTLDFQDLLECAQADNFEPVTSVDDLLDEFFSSS